MADRKYKAFISYSHRDRDWGARLHRALERYRVPRHIAGGNGRDGVVPARLIPIFRDREELPSSANLNEQIATALDQSDYLIVVCSPNAARSRWVNEEILRFKRLGRADRVLAFIIAGEPNATDKPDGEAGDECFPPALRFALDAEGNAAGAPVEPIAADARQEGDGEVNAILKLIAGLLGVGFDDLRRRELEAQRARTRLRMAIAAGFGILITGAIAAGWIAWERAEIAAERQVKAQLEQSLRLAAVARAQHDAGYPVRASLIAAEALALRRPGPVSREAQGALVAGYAQGTWLQGPIMVHDAQVLDVRFVDEGKRILSEGDDYSFRLWDAETGALLAKIAAPDDEVVYGSSLSPDRKRLLAIGEESVRLFDVERRSLIARLAHPGKISRARFAAEGRLIVTATEHGSLRLWNGETGAAVKEFDLTFPGTQNLFQYNLIALDDAGTRLVVINVDSRVQVWDVATGKRIADPREHSSAAAFSPDGKLIALAIDKTVELWDADMKAHIATLEHPGYVGLLRFSDDGGLLAVGAQRGAEDSGEDIHVWDVATREKRVVLKHDRSIVRCAFNADASQLVSVVDDDSVRLWDTTAGTQVGITIRDYAYVEQRGAPNGIGLPYQHPGSLQHAAFSPDGQRLVVGTRNGYAQVWDARLFTPDPQTVEPPGSEGGRVMPDRSAALDAQHTRLVRLNEGLIIISDLSGGGRDADFEVQRGFETASFTRDGAHLLLLGDDSRAGVLEIASRRMVLVARQEARMLGADFHRERARLLTVERDGVHLWNTTERKWLQLIEIEDVAMARFTPDGARILVATRDGTVQLRDAETGAALGKPMQSVGDSRDGFPLAQLDPGGGRILVAADASLRLWDAASGALVAQRAHDAPINSATYSPDGRHILTASSDGTARLWDAATLAPAGVLRHATAVFAATFSPDGTRVATLSWSTGAIVWDRASLAALGTMKVGARVMNSGVRSIAFSGDGKNLLALWQSGATWRWRVDGVLAPPADLPALAYLSSFPGLTAAERARYLAEAGTVEPDTPAARDPCDVAVADLSRRPLPAARNRVVTSTSASSQNERGLHLCTESAAAFADQPRFIHGQGLFLLAQDRKPEALEAFRRAADKGHQASLLEIARLYLDASFGGQDPAKAVETLRQASAKGVAAADSALAELHWRGQGVDKDRVRAIALWRTAAARGDAGACRKLAEMEESGAEPEVARDLRAALLHWTLAVEIADRAGADDSFARARRASLARHIGRAGQHDVVSAVWREAMRSLANQ